MFKKVDYVFFNVDDLDKAVAFYRDKLGLPVTYESTDWVELDAGNVTMALRRYGSGPEGRPELGVGEGATMVFEVDDMEAAQAELEKQGIECMIHYPIPIHLQPAYRNLYGYVGGEYPMSEEFSKRCLSIPVHSFLDVDDIKYTCEQIQAFYQKKSE